MKGSPRLSDATCADDLAEYLAELRTRLQAASDTAGVGDEHALSAEQSSQWRDKIDHYRDAFERYRIAVKIMDGVLSDWPEMGD